jgi:hypothetical protein
MSKEDKFYDLRSALESALEDFKQVCEENGRNFNDEVEDLLIDVKK